MISEDREYRLKKLRGLALGVFGSFIFAFSSIVVEAVKQQPAYLGIAALSVSVFVLAYAAVSGRSTLNQLLYVASAGAVLATEASLAILYLNAETAGLYAVITLLGSLLAFKGVRDIESFKYDLAREPQKHAPLSELT